MGKIGKVDRSHRSGGGRRVRRDTSPAIYNAVHIVHDPGTETGVPMDVWICRGGSSTWARTGSAAVAWSRPTAWSAA